MDNKNIFKKISTLCVTYIAALNLILLPIPINKSYALSQCSATTEEECEALESTEGCEWNGDRGCQLSERTEEMRDNFNEECAGDTGDEAIDCATTSSATTEATADFESYGGRGDAAEVLSSIEGGILGIGLFVAVVSLIGSKEKTFDCTSKTLFSATSVIAIGAELGIYFMSENKLRDLRCEYQQWVDPSIVSNEDNPCHNDDGMDSREAEDEAEDTAGDAYQAQIKAFEFLENEERFISDVAKQKMIAYFIAAAAYLITAIIAGVEMIPPAASACPKPAAPTTTYKKPESTQSNSQKLLYATVSTFLNFLVKKAIGDDIGTTLSSDVGSRNKTFGFDSGSSAETNKLYLALIVGGVMGVTQLFDFGKSMKKFLMSSPGILMLSIIMVVLDGIILGPVMYSIHKDSLANADKVAEIRAVFEASVTDFCPEGRDDLSNPDCYCYNDDNTKNEGRSNSETCNAAWAQQEYEIAQADPEVAEDTDSSLGCMTRAGEFDAKCQCKKFVDTKSGQNACYSVPLGTNALGSMGTNVGFPSALSALNSTANGSLPSESATNSLNNQGARNKKIKDQMIAKINKDRLKKGLSAIPDEKKLAVSTANKFITPKLLAAAKKGSLNFAQSIKDKTPRSDAMKKALKHMKKKVGYGSSGSLARKKSKKNNDMDFNFDGGGKGNKIDGFMKKKYRIGDDDIVKNDSASIWKVLTNRYNQSGLKRLFSDD